MKFSGIVSTRMVFVLIALLPVAAFAQKTGDGEGIKDRIAIQEKLLYAYAYAYDSKDCVSFSNLFTTDAVLDFSGLGLKVTTGRDAIRQGCIERQKNVVRDIRTHHYMMNIIFDQLTPHGAVTRTYCLLTWQKPGETTISVQGAFTYHDVIVKSDDGRWLFKERKAGTP